MQRKWQQEKQQKTQSEAQLERELITQLNGLGFASVTIGDADASNATSKHN